MNMANTAPARRIHSIDILRGIIMIIMALDHTRDFFSSLSYNPLDLDQTTPQMFLTRWITHYCAPVFVFLAGTSAYLSLSKHGSKKAASLFLLKRGIWLIVLELLVINLSWSFDVSYRHLFVQVLWAIGWSMIFLAAVIWLPLRYIALTGVAIIVLHNTLNPIVPEDLGGAGWLWMMLHEGGFVSFGKEAGLYFAYPVLPWMGVMAAGYAMGAVFRMADARRRKILMLAGLSCIALFVLLRFSNLYGDKEPWQHYATWWQTFLSFINCTKYPPSLLYVLMTVGPALAALSLLDHTDNKLSRFFTVYGRVPMFYYILHVPLIHTSAIVIAAIKGSNVARFTQSLFFAGPDPTWGFGLPVVYLVWIFIVLLLYFPCRWFMRLKARRKDWWLSYL